SLFDDGGRVWLDDILVIDDGVPDGAVTPVTSLPFTVTAGERKRIRIDFFELAGAASLDLKWALGTSTPQPIPDTAVTPGYNLPTSSTVDVSVPGASGLASNLVTPLSTSTGYGSNPWLGMATTSTIDPDGLGLTTTIGYEAPSTAANSWLRRLTRTMPSGGGAVTTSDYYADTEQLGAAVCGLPATMVQYGWLKSITGPTPASGSAVTTEYAYDVLGRTVGTKTTGDPAWSCVTYDARSRVAETAIAKGSGDERIVTPDYLVGGNPLVTSVTDPAGTITTTVDLLGRVVAYEDVWGTVTV